MSFFLTHGPSRCKPTYADRRQRYVWNDRKQFGQLVGEFQGMQHQIAQSYTEITAARHLVYNAARKKEAGEDFLMDAAMAKLYASQVAGRVSGLAVEWMGGMGFVREGLAEKYWRDSKIGAIYEGTSNIQYVKPPLLLPLHLCLNWAFTN